MDFRIQDQETAIKRDKPPIYYFAVSCLALGFQMHAVTMTIQGLYSIYAAIILVLRFFSVFAINWLLLG